MALARVTAAEALLHIQESLALESEEDFSSSDESGEDSEEERLYFEKRIDPKEDFCNRIVKGQLHSGLEPEPLSTTHCDHDKNIMDQQRQADRTGDYEVMSQVTGSKSFGRSSRSSASAAATKAKAKAEAALVEAKYAAQEAEMMKEKARIEAENQKMLAEAEQRKAELEANLYVLKVNRSAKAASAEAAVYEAAEAREPDTLEGITQIYPEDRTQRTNEYVQAHYVTPNAQQQAPVSQEPPAMPMSAERASPDPIQWYPIHDQEPRLSKLCIKDEGMPGAQNRGYSPWVPAPMSHSSSLRDYACEPAQITDLTKYLLEKPLRHNNYKTVSVRKTEVAVAPALHNSASVKKIEEPAERCPIHSKPHPLAKCRGFRVKHLDDRKAYLRENSICYRCCASTKHLAKDCKVAVKCKECNSDKHLTALHPGPAPWVTEVETTRQEHGGEQENSPSPEVISKCTEICDTSHGLRSCSKISLVSVYPVNEPKKVQKMYVVLDDQSNRSLAKSAFFDLFGISAVSSTYTLRTCAGIKEATGRKAHNFVVSSLDGKTRVLLPPLLECNTMPDDRSEIPTPDIVQHFPHLAPVAGEIPPIEPETPILLLLGRDVLSVHKVREQYNGPHNTPYAQRLDLGWVIVGEVCLGGVHKRTKVNVYKTNVLNNGRTSFLEPCLSTIHVKEKFSAPIQQTTDHASDIIQTAPLKLTDNLGLNVFQRNPDDDKTALSIEHKIFLEIMDREVYMDDDNHWVAPLPFRTPRPLLPNNREQALKRLTVLLRTLEKRKDMKEQFIEFMQKIFDNDQAEEAPPLEPGEECWYLPTFGVYHPQKPGKIRVVFDSSASFKGISLNDILLKGPDLNNTLLGVLLRFRQEQVAVTVDVEQMF
ncbi:hypothetical protein MHYP_G00343950 [Metynnis hypsauchen]